MSNPLLIFIPHSEEATPTSPLHWQAPEISPRKAPEYWYFPFQSLYAGHFRIRSKIQGPGQETQQTAAQKFTTAYARTARNIIAREEVLLSLHVKTVTRRLS